MSVGRNDPCPCGSGKKYKRCCQGKFEFRPPAQTAPKFDTAQALQDAMAHHNAGRLADAEHLYRRVLTIEPRNSHALNALGMIAFATGHYLQAEEFARQAIEIDRSHAIFHQNLGAILTALRRADEAEAICRRALEFDASHAETWNNLGSALLQQKRHAEAVEAHRRALALKADHPVFMINLGAALLAQDEFTETEAVLRRVVELAPNSAEACANLAAALEKQKRLAEALEFHRKARDLDPKNAGLINNLGVILCRVGKMREGIECFHEALKIDSHPPTTRGSLIFYMDLCPGFDTAAQQAERKSWAAQYADPLRQDRLFPNPPDPERILRIGYVSADFRDHSAANGFASLLRNFDRSNFEVYAYSNSSQCDDVTESLRRDVTGWRDIHALGDAEASKWIEEDGIDILADLSGHTAGSRLLVFARKPAPVQVSMMGYPTGTGMRAMDALFVDEVVIPPEEKQFYAEEVRYLPCLIDYSSQKEFPEINELPALSGKGITFGSFNRLVKLSDETLALWAQLLNTLPDGRLILKAGELEDEAARNRVVRHFQGIEDRITLLGKTSWLEHVRAYNLVDISLDPFPHGGGVTTIESIRMGVPVLTLRYPTFVGRASASILTTLGLADWIAETPEEYVRIAIEKSRDLAALSELRGNLRSVFASSILGDPEYYLRAAEKEYRALWREWCARQAS